MTPSPLPNRPFPPPGPSTSNEDQRLLDFRTATNFRSVTRNDPNVLEILDTSVYSVVYQYDEEAGEWEKQKQEGPLFVVKRSKTPEYALFMLNRQTVKNVLIPLVPGEIKCTIVDASTLQVARRGEKQRRGVWFSDGQGDVERFRDTIVRICGEPIKKPSPAPNALSQSTSSPAIPPPPVPTSVPNGGDDISRLFAGLTVAAPSGRSVSDTHALSRPSSGPTGSPPSDPARPRPRAAIGLTSTANQPNGQSAPLQQLQHATPPHVDPATVDPHHEDAATGQSAEDLLNSLLGLPPPPGPSRQPPLVTSPSAHALLDQTPLPAPVHAPAPPPIQQDPPSVGDSRITASDLLSQWVPPPSNVSPNLRKKSSRVAEATFAQAVATPPLPAPPVPQRPIHDGMMNGHVPPPNALRDSMMFHVGQIRPGMRSKGELVDQVEWLLHNDERFVDDLWRSYLERTRSNPG